MATSEMDTFSELLNGSTLNDLIDFDNEYFTEFLDNSLYCRDSDQFEASLKDAVDKCRKVPRKVHNDLNDALSDSSRKEWERISLPKLSKLKLDDDTPPATEVEKHSGEISVSGRQTKNSVNILKERMKFAKALPFDFFTLNGSEYIWTELLRIGHSTSDEEFADLIAKIQQFSKNIPAVERYDLLQNVAEFGVEKAIDMNISVRPEVRAIFDGPEFTLDCDKILYDDVGTQTE